MYDFPQLPLSKHSNRNKSAVCGVGINDAEYQVQPRIKGVKIQCPIYTIWHNMIKRCYSAKTQEVRPRYAGCSVHDDWLRFSLFRKWVLSQDYKGKHLDKDLLVTGNMIYSEKTCIFVTRNINGLLCDRLAARGSTSIGVVIDKSMKSGRVFIAQCTANSKRVPLGRYASEGEASEAYLKFKSNHVRGIALEQSDQRLKAALIRISGEISRGEYYK